MTSITPEQYDQIKDVLPIQRGNVRIPNITFLNAIFHMAESGCKWRQMPKEFGAWHTIYVRMQRWADKGVWLRVQNALQSKLGIGLHLTALLSGETVFEESSQKVEIPNNATLMSVPEDAATENCEDTIAIMETTTETVHLMDQTPEVHTQSTHHNDTPVE